jgi:hypothetical protein
MTNDAFKRGFAALTAAFPGMNFNARLYWELLSDLDGQFFLAAVWEFIKTHKEIFPGTNPIAILRERAVALLTEARQNTSIKIEAETEKERVERWRKEASPMPEECKQALSKLGAKFD